MDCSLIRLGMDSPAMGEEVIEYRTLWILVFGRCSSSFVSSCHVFSQDCIIRIAWPGHTALRTIKTFYF